LPSDIDNLQIINKGDILLSLTGNVGRVCLSTAGNLLLNQRVAKIVPNSLISLKYLYYCLGRKFTSKMERFGQGGAQKNIYEKDVMNYNVPICAMSEQIKIVESIDVFVARLSSSQKEMNSLSQLKQYLMTKLFK
jgi:type I restriction enzyme S subunit